MQKMVKKTGRHKQFEYYKQSLIEEKNLFRIDNGGTGSGEVSSIFLNTDMYGQVVNVTLPSDFIHIFF